MTSLYVRAAHVALYGVPMGASPFAKEHRSRALADAATRASGLKQLMLRPVLVFKPRVKSSLRCRDLCSFSLQDLAAAAAAARGDQSIMISIMMRLATSALRLHVITIRADSTATGAIFKETRSFSTEHSLHRWSGRDYQQSSTPSFVGHNIQPPLDHIAFKTRTLYSAEENTHLRAGTER